MARKQMKLTMSTRMTLEEVIEEFLLDCEARNLRAGTIKHYKDSVKQIYKYVPRETPIEEIDEDTLGNGQLLVINRSSAEQFG